MLAICPVGLDLACTHPNCGIIVWSESQGGAAVGMLRHYYRMITLIVEPDAKDDAWYTYNKHKIEKHNESI